MRVLFVDDDKRLLGSLRRMSISEKDMKAAFAEGSKQALELLAKSEFDIVVTDMRMPGMDGASLLEIVHEQYPETVRLIFSGHSDQEMIMPSVRSAHQFLSKPCPYEKIMSVLRRLYGLRSVFTNQRIRKMVNRIYMLPVLPQPYADLMNELNKDDCSLSKVGAIISVDVGLSAGILKVVNSSFFGLPRAISTPNQAATYLGVDLLRGLVLSHHLFEVLKSSNHPEFHINMLWTHCMNVGLCCKAICMDPHLNLDGDQGFNAGLLHDVGKLILAYKLSEEYAEVIREVREGNARMAEAERRILGVSHAGLGAYLLGLWGFPEDLVMAVARHHAPAAEPGKAGLAEALYASNVFEHQLVVVNKGYTRPFLDMEYLESAGVSQEIAGRWRQACVKQLDLEDA